MTRRTVGAPVILDPQQPGRGSITERDVVRCLGSGGDPDAGFDPGVAGVRGQRSGRYRFPVAIRAARRDEFRH